MNFQYNNHSKLDFFDVNLDREESETVETD